MVSLKRYAYCPFALLHYFGGALLLWSLLFYFLLVFVRLIIT